MIANRTLSDYLKIYDVVEQIPNRLKPTDFTLAEPDSLHYPST